MNIRGWAFTSQEAEGRAANRARFNELKHLRNKEHIEWSTRPAYATTHFTGELLSEEAKALTEFEIALIMDCGNLCFGGACSKNGARFSGEYHTD
ncbi:hypothetical protein [Yersinia phage vB_YenM_P778]